MGTAEDFTGGKITRLFSRATESMFQSVALMIFMLIPTLTLAAGVVAPQLKLREVHSYELLSRFWRLKQPG
jgi:hypothetical protein